MAAPTHTTFDQEHERKTRSQSPGHRSTAPINAPGNTLGLLQHLQRTVGNNAVNQLLRQYALRQAQTPPEQATGAHVNSCASIGGMAVRYARPEQSTSTVMQRDTRELPWLQRAYTYNSSMIYRDDDDGGSGQQDGHEMSSSSGSSGSGGDGGGGGGGGTGPRPADPANCKVDVRATHIGAGGPLAHLPIWHTFVVYTDPTAVDYYFRGGPGGSCPGTPGVDPQYGTITTGHGPYVAGTIDWSPGAPSVTVAKGTAAAGKDSTFTATLARIDSGCTPYHPTGPNSNTTAKTMLGDASLPLDKPVSIAPGWDDPAL